MPWRRVGPDVAKSTRLGFHSLHVHTYDGKAQIAVKNLVSLLRDWISTVFRVSVAQPNKYLLCFTNYCVASGALTTL